MPPDLPRFSLRLHQGLTPQACRALAASAEAHGFHTLWFAENPFGRAILPAVAGCAADTSRVRLGLGILNPYQHHPTLIAQEAAALDELSGGRVRLGIGRWSFDIVQYLPCAARPDGAEAREIAKEAVGAMLIALWPTGNDWPAQRETIVRLSGIARPEMVGALDRLRRGERAGRVLDDRFISGFALAGTAEQVIAQAAQYRRAGADELALSFAGPQPAADAAYFARAVKRLIPDGELAIDVRRNPPDSG
jgi:alkanesulfonate monooxygenase SsuD/methylene tetrahydromethanopterin reductase-like flavin-dependent oxidoreductase (luciferase family)